MRFNGRKLKLTHRQFGETALVSRIVGRLAMLARQLSRGDTSGAFDDVRRWLASETTANGLRHDFTKSYDPPPPAQVPLTIVKVDDGLAKTIFDPTGLDEVNRALLERRQAVWEVGFDGTYAAVTDEGQPVYLQWLILPDERDKVKSHWGPLFPDLEPDMALAEGAWIPPQFRKRNIMSQASAMINDEVRRNASDRIRYVDTYVPVHNRGATKALLAAGFEPYVVRTETWRAGRRSVSFGPVDA